MCFSNDLPDGSTLTAEQRNVNAHFTEDGTRGACGAGCWQRIAFIYCRVVCKGSKLAFERSLCIALGMSPWSLPICLQEPLRIELCLVGTLGTNVASITSVYILRSRHPLVFNCCGVDGRPSYTTKRVFRLRGTKLISPMHGEVVHSGLRRINKPYCRPVL